MRKRTETNFEWQGRFYRINPATVLSENHPKRTLRYSDGHKSILHKIYKYLVANDLGATLKIRSQIFDSLVQSSAIGNFRTACVGRANFASSRAWGKSGAHLRAIWVTYK